MEKMWNVYLIHHSHTDIGYTERQEKIMRYHYDFIRQAIEILDDIHSGKTTGCVAESAVFFPTFSSLEKQI